MSTRQSQNELARIAARQLADYDARTPGTVFAEGLTLSEADAYLVQGRVAALRQQRGEAIVGYKIGCTSPVIQRQLGIDHPVFGRLFATERHVSGVKLRLSDFAHLAIEGELAVRLSEDIPSDITSDDELKRKIGGVFPVIELHHHVMRGQGPAVAELIANNAIHAGFVTPTQPAIRWQDACEDLEIRLDDQVEVTGAGRETTAGVLCSLRWLSKTLPRQGLPLRQGQIILTGSRAKLFPIAAPCRVTVKNSHFGETCAFFIQ